MFSTLIATQFALQIHPSLLENVRAKFGERMTEISDIELVSQILHQDQNGLSILYDRYGKQIYSFAYHTLQNQNDAEEVTQDVFLTLWEKSDKWDSAKGSLISWLMRLTRNKSIDRIRKRQRSPQLVDSDFEETLQYIAIKGDGVGGEMWQNGQIIHALLQKLPSEQSKLIELAFYKGMTHSELSESLEIPLGTVKTRLRSGLQKLRDMWQIEVEYEQ